MALKLTKLQAVNIMFSNIGQSPVTSLTSPNPAVNLAEGILDEVNNTVQSERWGFNTEDGYPFTPDGAGNILIPDNVLCLDLAPWDQKNLVIREGKLYDKHEHSFLFTETQYLSVVWIFTFENLPEVFKQYITTRAANLFASRAHGTKETAAYSDREELQARAACMEYETLQGDYNIFNDEAGNVPPGRYIPYQVVIRR
jgi:hypothetical protein